MTKLVLKGSLLGLQKSLKSLAKDFGITAIILLAVVILSFPYFLKDSELPLGKESYYYLELSENILNGDFPKFFDFGWPGLIALISFIFNLKPEIGMNILLFLSGIFCVILFYNLLNRFDFSIKFISSALLIISPAFIYVFTIGGHYAIPVFLSLLFSYFVLNKKYVLAGIAFFLMPFFSIENFILIVILFLFYLIYMKSKKRAFLFILVILTLSFFSSCTYNFNFISDLGSEIGVSVFSIFLFFVGFGFFWRKKQYFLLYLICVILFLFNLKFPFVLIYFNLFLSVLITLSFIELYKRIWESDIIKNLTLLLLICGLLFSGLSYAKETSEKLPNKEFFEALDKIPDNSFVFSSEYNKYWINYVNKNFVKIEGKDYEEILMLRDAEISRFLLEKYNIDYILIDKKMEKNIWGNKKQGLLWVVNYDTEHFINVYSGDYINIWRFK